MKIGVINGIPHMNNSFQLFRLQQKDTILDKTDKRLEEIDYQLHHDAEIEQLKEILIEIQNEIDPLNSKVAEITDKIQENNIRIEQTNASLYSGKVSNPKELQDLEMEIRSLKNAIDIYENEFFALISNLEIVEQKKVDVQKLLSSNNSRFQTQVSLLSAEKEELSAQIITFNTERAIIASQLDVKTLLLYSKLREQKNGIAVTTILDSSCAACGSMLTPAQCQQAKSTTEYFFCPSCGRIIYAG